MRPTADSVDVKVGSRLKEIRLMRGLTQDKLAVMIGITMQQIQKYERGRNRISASRIYSLSKALDVSIDEFFAHVNVDQPSQSGKVDMAIDEETARFVKSIRKIKNPKVRASLMDFIKSLADKAA